jgi:hypothetical protein
MRSALMRAAAPLIAAPLIAGALTVAAPAAAATPGGLGDSPVVAAAPGDDATDPERPVRIDVGRFDPRTVTPGAVVTVTGTLTNTGPTTITDIGVRLQRGDVLTTRAELAALTEDPDPATSVLPAFHQVDGALPAGGELPFSYTIDSAQLRMDRDGVYPVLINVNGTVDGSDQRRVGELSSFVVQQPVEPTTRTTVAWLWPLGERSHRNASGGFTDDELAASVASGGRLDRALDVVERLPRTLPPGGTTPVPDLPVTLAIDPALVEELEIMAAGPYGVGGVDGAGRGTDSARAFLDRLRSAASVHPVVALPYGDVDADALTTAGLSDVLTRSLPGTAAGTAEDPPGDGAQNGAAATSSSAAATGSTAPQDGGEPATGAGAEILADALDIEPRTDLAWPAGRSLLPATLTTLEDGGVQHVVLGSGALTAGDAAVGLDGRSTGPHTTVGTPTGRLDALVADDTLSEVVGSAERAPGGARMAEQRYLAELAVLDLQAPAGTEQTVLVAPPREIEAGPDGAGAMMADTAGGLLWLRPGALEGLEAAPVFPAGDLVHPGDIHPGNIHPGNDERLDQAGMADVVASASAREDLAGAVVGDAGAALRKYDAGTARAVSVAWWSDPAGFHDTARNLRTTLDRLRGRVTLLAPADGTYSLASSDAPLVLTVRNDLPFAVSVLLDVRVRGNRGLSIGDIGAQTLAPGERTTLQVPTEVQQSGGFAVTAVLTTPGGGPLGDRVQMQVNSTAYGPISLLITIGAGALLGLLFLRRLVRFVLRRRRGAADAEATGPAPEGAAVPQPPTRSPV